MSAAGIFLQHASPDHTREPDLLFEWRRSSTTGPRPIRPFPGRVEHSDKTVRCLGWVGFIANRKELARRIGSDFVDDVPLLLELYSREGATGAARRIAGPFSAAIWDGSHRRLCLIGDRTGQRPLYYCVRNSTFEFSSALEPLLRSREPDFNKRTIVADLHCLGPLPGETFYEGIQRLKPGEVLVVAEKSIESYCYWRIPDKVRSATDSALDLTGAWRELFLEVTSQYFADRESALLLSGGMDSSSLAASALHSGRSVAGFSWVTPELPESDESRLIDDVCRHLGVKTISIRLDRLWPLSHPEGFRTRPGSPWFSAHHEGLDRAFRLMREQGIRCALTGAGGDEMFGAVAGYADLLLTGRLPSLYSQVREDLSSGGLPRSIVSRTFEPIVRNYFTRSRHRLKRPLPWLRPSLRSTFQECIPVLRVARRQLPGTQDRLRILQESFRSTIYAEMNQMAARYGIELRHPLLDHRLIEFAWALLPSHTFRAGHFKTIHRQAMRGMLPLSVLNSKRKITQRSVFERGLREKEPSKVWDKLEGMRAERLGFVDAKILRRHYRDYVEGRHGHTEFWNTLTLEDWLRRYFHPGN